MHHCQWMCGTVRKITGFRGNESSGKMKAVYYPKQCFPCCVCGNTGVLWAGQKCSATQIRQKTKTWVVLYYVCMWCVLTECFSISCFVMSQRFKLMFLQRWHSSSTVVADSFYLSYISVPMSGTSSPLWRSPDLNF